MRINFDYEARKAGIGYPKWFQHLFNDLAEAYAIEYQLEKRLILNAIHNKDNINELKSMFQFIGLETETYQLPHLPSWGITFSDDQSIVVEYKLKYS